MVVEVGPEIEQLVFEICSGPEQHAIQMLASKGADQPFHERVGQGNVGDGLDFRHLQYPQIGLPWRGRTQSPPFPSTFGFSKRRGSGVCSERTVWKVICVA